MQGLQQPLLWDEEGSWEMQLGKQVAPGWILTKPGGQTSEDITTNMAIPDPVLPSCRVGEWKRVVIKS